MHRTVIEIESTGDGAGDALPVKMVAVRVVDVASDSISDSPELPEGWVVVPIDGQRFSACSASGGISQVDVRTTGLWVEAAGVRIRVRHTADSQWTESVDGRTSLASMQDLTQVWEPQLVICSDASEARHSLGKDGVELIVGRDPKQSDVAIEDRHVSSRHAAFYRTGNVSHVKDLKSRHGTMLNDREISGAEALSHGDRITLGSTVIRFTNMSEVLRKILERSQASSGLQTNEQARASVTTDACDSVVDLLEALAAGTHAGGIEQRRGACKASVTAWLLHGRGLYVLIGVIAVMAVGILAIMWL
jgi:FHA domain